MDDEMRRYFLGPMPVKEFFRKFLPIRKLSEEDRATLPGFEAIENAKKNAMYDEFVRCFLHPIYFSFPIVTLSSGRHRKFLLSQHQSVQLSRGSEHRIRPEVQARHRFLRPHQKPSRRSCCLFPTHGTLRRVQTGVNFRPLRRHR